MLGATIACIRCGLNGICKFDWILDEMISRSVCSATMSKFQLYLWHYGWSPMRTPVDIHIIYVVSNVSQFGDNSIGKWSTLNKIEFLSVVVAKEAVI